jgi:hypothetical protein
VPLASVALLICPVSDMAVQVYVLRLKKHA